MTHRNDRALTVGSLARVEGEGAMHVRVKEGRVSDVQLNIYEPPRFFEAFLRGRAYTEPPDITARICGICPVAYQTSACLAIEDDRLVLSVNAPDSGAADEELAVAYGDERLEIGFNAKYLLEIAGQVDRENAVFLFNSAGDPTLMREGNDETAVYVVMPMRV